MGQHFDSLVDIVKKHISRDEKAKFIPNNVNDYLNQLIRRAALFEFPVAAKDVHTMAKTENSVQYDKYIRDYYNLSEQNGEFLITPFPITAIEDIDSVVMLDNIKDNEYIYTAAHTGRMGDAYEKYGIANTRGNDDVILTSVDCAYVVANKPEPGASGAWRRVLPVYNCVLHDGVRALTENPIAQAHLKAATMKDVSNGFTSYVEELVYLMDPDNFIIRQENNASKKRNSSLKRKKKKINKTPLRKTIMRPHYICLSQEDTGDFLRSESKTPRAAHPVRGHWRHLQSERYKKMRGQIIFVKQYFTGEGQVKGECGWTYEVMIKQSPTELLPYNKAKDLEKAE